MNETLTLSQIEWEFIIGGLAIFLFGIELMGNSLTNYAGGKIREYINKYTSNTLSAIIVGIVLTAIIQSSTATTVIVIALVRAGLMKLDQAIGVSMGANVGTTFTSVLVSLRIEYWAYYILFIGVIVLMVSNRKKTRYFAEIMIGFSLIFVGLTMMGDALKDISKVKGFSELILNMSTQPVIALIGGTLLTAVIQSSTAVVGIVQKLHEQGAMTLIAGSAIVFGSNIGTTVTALLASIGGSYASKRASLFHLLFNVIGAVAFMFVLVPYTNMIQWLVDTFRLNNLMAIALSHFLFNLISTIIFIPLVKQSARLMEFLIPGEDNARFSDIGVFEFDEQLITSFPAGALGVTKNAIVKTGELVTDSIQANQDYLMTKDHKHADTVIQLEEIVNSLDLTITSYLLKIGKTNLSEDLAIEYTTNLQVIKNLERISDLSTNLIEFYELIYENKEELSSAAIQELSEIYSLLLHNLTTALEIYKTQDFSSFETLTEDENYMDLLEFQFKENYFQRITDIKTTADVSSSVYIDILGTLERMADHSYNIAVNTKNPMKGHDSYATIS